MEAIKKRCEFCGQWFSPSPYAPHQKCCPDPICKRKRKSRANKNWRGENQDYEKGRNDEKREWAANYPNYWRKYRKNHPNYTQKERKRMLVVRKKAKIVARQDTARRISLEKLENIRELGSNSVARQDAASSQIKKILDYLFWKETVARQDKVEKQLCEAR